MKLAKLEQILNQFLSKEFQLNRGPILLALSGGIDSLALFHALLSLQSIQKFDLHVAHLDHQWREESFQEAAAIKKMVEDCEIPCHVLSVNSKRLGGNLENTCRDLRRNYFLKLHKKHKYQGLMLAHQANDQAETVLKRLFEGATWSKISGIKKNTRIEDLIIWRPWLGLKRQSIESYAKSLFLKPFDDPSNQDCHFLRARMRKELIPELSKVFGKDVTSSLCRLAEEALELSDYLDRRVETLLLSGKRKAEDLYFKIPDATDLIEIKHFLRCLFEREKIPKYHTVLERISKGLSDGDFNLCFKLGRQNLRVHGHYLILQNKFSLSKKCVTLENAN